MDCYTKMTTSFVGQHDASLLNSYGGDITDELGGTRKDPWRRGYINPHEGSADPALDSRFDVFSSAVDDDAFGDIDGADDDVGREIDVALEAASEVEDDYGDYGAGTDDQDDKLLAMFDDISMGHGGRLTLRRSLRLGRRIKGEKSTRRVIRDYSRIL